MRFFIAFFFVVTFNLSAQEPIVKTEWYATLSGAVGEQSISISLIALDDERFKGSICTTDGKKTFYGIMENHALLFDLMTDRFNGSFHLKPIIVDGYIDSYQGEYLSYKIDPVTPVSLTYSSGSWGLPDNSYPDFPGSDEALENFAQETIEAIIAKDVDFLSSSMCYPAIIYVDKKEKLDLKNAQDFKNNSDRILTDVLLNKALDWNSCNLFSNHSGVMLGNGEVWIWRPDTSTDENPQFCISNIVSYL